MKRFGLLAMILVIVFAARLLYYGHSGISPPDDNLTVTLKYNETIPITGPMTTADPAVVNQARITDPEPASLWLNGTKIRHAIVIKGNETMVDHYLLAGILKSENEYTPANKSHVLRYFVPNTRNQATEHPAYPRGSPFPNLRI